MERQFLQSWAGGGGYRVWAMPPAGRPRKSAAAIDRDVLAAWLGDDRAAINSLLGEFRETAMRRSGRSMLPRAPATSRPWPRRRISSMAAPSGR